MSDLIFSEEGPHGTYGLVQPIAGCPRLVNPSGGDWEAGYRHFDTENTVSRNDWSKGIHIAGKVC